MPQRTRAWAAPRPAPVTPFVAGEPARHPVWGFGGSGAGGLRDAQPVTTVLLGPVKRDVGAPHEELRGAAVIGEDRNPQRERHGFEDPAAVSHLELPGGVADPLGALAGDVRRDVLEDDHELLAAVPARDVARTHLAL